MLQVLDYIWAAACVVSVCGVKPYIELPQPISPIRIEDLRDMTPAKRNTFCSMNANKEVCKSL